MTSRRSIGFNKSRWFQRYLDALESAEYNLSHKRWEQAGQAYKSVGVALIQYQRWVDVEQQLDTQP
jgi:hypothetical protein